jgi:hypothetical protein
MATSGDFNLAIDTKSRSRGKIHDWYCHGLIASTASHRRTVDAESDDASPSLTAWAASSDELHRDSGTSRRAGASHAMALTAATTSGPNRRGRPDRGRSSSPARPCSQNRFPPPRHHIDVHTQLLSDVNVGDTRPREQHNARPHYI